MTTRAQETGPASRLAARGLCVGYDDRRVIDGLDATIPGDSFTVIVGPNACGKSTLLRSLARLLKPSGGAVVLDGEDIHKLAAKSVAQRLGLLPQTSIAPDGITVVDLVSRGRFPHQGVLRRWSDDDERAVVHAMEATSVTGFSTRPVDQLSGGQRQRVWIAMVLAQETPLLLLDEPTTYLDIAYQIEVLDLCRQLNRDGRTLVAVLHDLNQAARYATHIVAMRDGSIVAQGAPREVVTSELVHRIFGVHTRIIEDPESGTPLVIPLANGAVR